MNYYSDTIKSLPREILFFKNMSLKQNDPIKRYVFKLKEIIYIMKHLKKFSVPYKTFLKIYSLNNKDELIKLLCKFYLKKNVELLNLKDYKHIEKFICIFFDYNNPISHKDSNELLWIYPNLQVKKFITDSLFENKSNQIYFDKLAIHNLIRIFTEFTKYEYSNCDENIDMLFEGLNYPSLILANIDLYDKGYIEIIEDSKEIRLFLNKSKRINKDSIFSEERNLIKNHILEFINSSESSKYSLQDFI